MDSFNYSFQIDREMYAELFRKHLSYKFHLHRSLYMSLSLYLFGLVMMYGFHMDFAFVNTIVFWILIFSLVVNVFADFYLARKSFDSFKLRNISQGNLKIDSTGIHVTQGKSESKNSWDLFDSYIENDEAYMFYKGDIFIVVPKQFEHEYYEVMNSILNIHFNKKRKRK